jgi:hypothetical protein
MTLTQSDSLRTIACAGFVPIWEGQSFVGPWVSSVSASTEALSLLENDVVAATKWMSSQVQGIGSKRPLDMLRTRVETEAVFDLIGRLERGVLV